MSLSLFVRVLIACALVAVTVAIHAAGLTALLRSLMRSEAALPSSFWPITWMLVRVTWTLIVIHLVEIAVWAFLYLWVGSLPDLESALYFSGTTYSTVGYGDVVLPKTWRFLGPVEGLTGILMCGLSTGLFFAVLNKVLAQTRATRAVLGE